MNRYSSLAWPSVSRLTASTFVPNRVRVAALRAFGAQIERGVLIRPRVRVHAPDRLSIGADSWIGENVTVANSGGDVRIGSNVVLSQSASLITHATSDEPMVIDDGAWIALRATVVGPVRIGRRAVGLCPSGRRR